MLAVKKFIYLSLFLFSYQAISQEITGTYQLIDPSLIIADLGVTYNFKVNGPFDKTTYEHLGQKTISGGNYHISRDTIVFKYKPQDTILQSEVKLRKRISMIGKNYFYELGFTTVMENLILV
ncbi:hypothetical protein [Gillisia limnaea]|uniref:Uncharacterized protein n=1 Tax=Gillisia limnaea (strain DSM 15749 / LMG 21470 / R-8282) TaxID=865937 RepID=H2BWN5_GILLR|nr:hypothetical protein [Gillisia limnaea]EHQ03013.1 hypothetical protein Gilli_2387 [Gillisia limnaea DSM 15749]